MNKLLCLTIGVPIYHGNNGKHTAVRNPHTLVLGKPDRWGYIYSIISGNLQKHFQLVGYLETINFAPKYDYDTIHDRLSQTQF